MTPPVRLPQAPGWAFVESDDGHSHVVPYDEWDMHEYEGHCSCNPVLDEGIRKLVAKGTCSGQLLQHKPLRTKLN